MKINKYSNRIKEFEKLLTKLLEKDSLSIKEIVSKSPNSFNFKGVYLISTPTDSEIVWAGMTDKTIYNRIFDHQRLGHRPSNLKAILKNNSNYPQDIENYLVRCIEIAKNRRRSLFEHFAISILEPTFNK